MLWVWRLALQHGNPEFRATTFTMCRLIALTHGDTEVGGCARASQEHSHLGRRKCVVHAQETENVEPLRSRTSDHKGRAAFQGQEILLPECLQLRLLNHCSNARACGQRIIDVIQSYDAKSPSFRGTSFVPLTPERCVEKLR